MSNELKVTKEAVERAAEKCPQAKAVLTELFPDVFKPKEEWEDVTRECLIRTHGEGRLFLHWDNEKQFSLIGEIMHAICLNTRFKVSEGRIWRRK